MLPVDLEASSEWLRGEDFVTGLPVQDSAFVKAGDSIKVTSARNLECQMGE